MISRRCSPPDLVLDVAAGEDHPHGAGDLCREANGELRFALDTMVWSVRSAVRFGVMPALQQKETLGILNPPVWFALVPVLVCGCIAEHVRVAPVVVIVVVGVGVEVGVAAVP